MYTMTHNNERFSVSLFGQQKTNTHKISYLMILNTIIFPLFVFDGEKTSDTHTLSISDVLHI